MIDIMQKLWDAPDVNNIAPAVPEVVVTTNESGQCVAVTRQNEDGQIVKVIWAAPTPPTNIDSELREAARAVVEQWLTPSEITDDEWARQIDRLRKAL